MRQCQCAQPDSTGKEQLEAVTRQNIENSLAEIIEGSPYLRTCIERGEMGLVGAYHDIATRTVQFGELVTPDRFARYRSARAGLAA